MCSLVYLVYLLTVLKSFLCFQALVFNICYAFLSFTIYDIPVLNSLNSFLFIFIFLLPFYFLTDMEVSSCMLGRPLNILLHVSNELFYLSRKTNETTITVDICLDGTGKAEVRARHHSADRPP